MHNCSIVMLFCCVRKFFVFVEEGVSRSGILGGLEIFLVSILVPCIFDLLIRKSF
jgi:hypothetical protein